MNFFGVWGGPSEAGKSPEEVDRYVERLHKAGFNAIFMHLKGGDGLLYWPSKRFPECIAPDYRDWDFPQALLESCQKRGVQVHAWMIDFFEGENGVAFSRQPQWAMRNAAGKTTNEEILRGQRFTPLWMCPAQRPGYVDQWLVPVYQEFAELYAFDGVHHDYVRYPGDVAPDQYCFCDYCLEHMPRFNGFINEAIPDDPFYHELYDRPYLEAHWEQSPRVLPANWEKLDRTSKSRFLQEGSFFSGGRYDLDYFFYTYRTHWITEFTRVASEAVRQARPGMKISAAVFKNPVHSGRFIGQDWRQFAPYVDMAIPMDYRDHFPGDFETYLTLLTEAIQRQKGWARDFEHLYIGAAVNFLFKEEPGGPYPVDKFRRLTEAISSAGAEGMVVFCDSQLESYGILPHTKGIFETVRS